ETLIIDKCSDLNLYKEGNFFDKSAQQRSGDGGVCLIGCCNAESPMPQKAVSDGGCCSTSCSNAEPPTAQEAITVSTDYNINEWVCECSFITYFTTETNKSLLYQSLLSDLCSQAPSLDVLSPRIHSSRPNICI